MGRRVVKKDSGLPVCKAKVHICEVDKVLRWILRLADEDILRLRDDIVVELEKELPRRRRIPLPDPPPFEKIKNGLINLSEVNPQPEPTTGGPGFSKFEEVSFNPQPEPPAQKNIETAAPIPLSSQSALYSSSVQMVRQSLLDNIEVVIH